MQFSFVLSKYLARRFFMSVMLVLVIMVAVTFLVDIVNLGGRAASRESANLALVLDMALLRIPYFMVKILPFAVLFGTMLTYVWLTRTHELVVMRATGVSVWQFLLPALVITALLGIATITIFNPLASALISRFEQLENRNVRSQANVLAVSPGTMWIREGDDERQSVIHANEVSASGTELEDVIILVFGENDRFIERYDAQKATLGDHLWEMEEVLISRPDERTERVATRDVPTELSLDRPAGRLRIARNHLVLGSSRLHRQHGNCRLFRTAAPHPLACRARHTTLSCFHGAGGRYLLAPPDTPGQSRSLRRRRSGIRVCRLRRIPISSSPTACRAISRSCLPCGGLLQSSPRSEAPCCSIRKTDR